MPEIHTLFPPAGQLYSATLTGDRMVDDRGQWTDYHPSVTSDENNLIDNRTSLSALFTGGDNGDHVYCSGIRIDLGEIVMVDFVAINLPTALAGFRVNLYGAANPGGLYSQLYTFEDPVSGWSIGELYNPASLRYYVIQIEIDPAYPDTPWYDKQINEVVIGKKLELKKFVTGGQLPPPDAGVRINTSEGGVDWGVMLYPAERRIRSESIAAIKDSLKADLITFISAVKVPALYSYLIYFSDDDEYWWVRHKAGSFRITKAKGLYKTSFEVIEQLS